jgi:predicted Ser/Thr protein kinase
MVGKTISHYRIEQKLGQGGMGVVYRAVDTRLNRTVALKMLLPELAADASLRRRLANEARAASALNHPVIATVHDFEQVDECLFIVYEFVEGSTLRDVMNKRRMELVEWLSVCIKIADGLASAHETGIIHRDLKPENVMLTAEGRVKILDFGLAKIHRPLESATAGAQAGTLASATAVTGAVVGTLNYMSPEQLEAQSVDHRSDVFSFGIMLYELVAGRHPFLGRSPLSTIGNILKEEPPAPSLSSAQLPPELERVIHKCLRKQRAERYQSARDLLVDLENLRRNLSGGTAAAVVPPEEEFGLPRGLARGLLLLIQIGYLCMYGAALVHAEALEKGILSVLGALTVPLAVILAMCGIAVRLYLLAAVGLDHPAAGVRFRRLFPALLALDAVWAASPLLLFGKLGWPALGAVAALAYLPFCQRTLIQSAYQLTAAARTPAPSGARPEAGR